MTKVTKLAISLVIRKLQKRNAPYLKANVQENQMDKLKDLGNFFFNR